MSLLNKLFGLLKKLVILVVIVAIAIPIRYGSTNRKHLSLRVLHSALSWKRTFLPDPTRPTLSADYRAFEDIIRMKPLADHDPLEDPLVVIKRLRTSFGMSNIIPKPSLCQIRQEIFEHDGHSVDTYWIEYSTRKFQVKTDKLIVYFHGGAYMVGHIHSKSFVVLT